MGRRIAASVSFVSSVSAAPAASASLSPAPASAAGLVDAGTQGTPEIANYKYFTSHHS